MVGIVLSVVGMILWARHFSERKRLKVAGLIFVLGMIVFMIVPNNVHGPGMLLGLTDICALILSIVLAVMAFAGREPSSGSNSTPEERK